MVFTVYVVNEERTVTGGEMNLKNTFCNVFLEGVVFVFPATMIHSNLGEPDLAGGLD